MLMLLAVNAFMLAVGPFLYSLYSRDPALEKAARGRLLTYFTFILSLGGLVVTLFAHEALTVLAPAFVDSAWAVGPLAFGVVAYGMATLLTTGFALARRTGSAAALSVLAAGANIALNLALIPPFGFVGASVATGSGYLVLAASYYFVSQRIYPTPYELRRVTTVYATAAALGAAAYLPVDSELFAIALKIIALGAFFAVVTATRAMRRGEWLELRRFVIGMVTPRRAATSG
jgi:O-antigen/teichoic acid export membrane protein